MARVTSPLKDTQIKQAKPRQKEFNLSDGEGLQLRVKPSGTKMWLLNYVIPYTSRRTNMSLGVYPDISLAAARKLRAEYRGLLAQNIDPKEHRDRMERGERAERENTLVSVAEKWIAWKRSSVSEATADTAWLRLGKHVFPSLGKMPISKVSIHEVERTFMPLVNEEKFETVQRLCRLLREICEFAVVRKILPLNHLGSVSKLFPPPKVRHAPSIPPEELPAFLLSLSRANIYESTLHLILWQLFTMTRPFEAATAKWSEIDFRKRTWMIPSTKTKMRRDHVVYLSEQMIGLLQAIKASDPAREHIFPNLRDPRRPVSSQTANAAIKRMGYKGRQVAHGFRSLACTVLNESGLFRSEVIERSLAHVDKNSVRVIYNRAEYEEERFELMGWWSDYIEEAMKKTKVNIAGLGHRRLELVI